MGFKETSTKLLMSIPHIALLWDMRRHPRYTPCEGCEIEIRNEKFKIYAILLDICIGGMRLISTDKRIKSSKTISLIVNEFRIDIPCDKIRRIDYCYGVKFGFMENYKIDELNLFIEKYTKKTSSYGLTEILK